MRSGRSEGFVARLMRFCLDNPLLVLILLGGLAFAGIVNAPFDWELGDLPRDPVPVDAIPDLGENQQIVLTEWPGRSPRDVEDQITYPLTAALLGLADVRTVRSFSRLGFSAIHVIFTDEADFYDSRSRIVERLTGLPAGVLPAGVSPSLGPDATALGQIYWYTLEGRDPQGRPAGGWDPAELRAIQDWQVRYALTAVPGVAEVASVGGFVREYQVDVDPDALLALDVPLRDVAAAVGGSNSDVGAGAIENNGVEYLVRGRGLLEAPRDISAAVVGLRDGAPVRVGDLATVGLGPAPRRGVLDKGGADAVGGVVAARHGANPLEVINGVKAAVAEISAGLPARTLPDGTVSRVTVVPFYDRSKLIGETLGTLSDALRNQILVTVLVVLVMVRRLRGSLLVAGLLPAAVLACFTAMRIFGVDANIVALTGIAIAIGTMVDMGIVMVENVLRRLDESDPGADRSRTVLEAAAEVAPAVLTAVATTVISFLPVFTLEGAEGKLFRPLAWTKTFALSASLLLAVVVLPPISHLVLRRSGGGGGLREMLRRGRGGGAGRWVFPIAAAAAMALLAVVWRPLGPGAGLPADLAFVAAAALLVVGPLYLFRRAYPRLLGWALDHKALFLLLPLALVAAGAVSWRSLGREFMPPLDEGSFLYMPTTMPHAGLGEATDALRKLDAAMAAIPEVEQVVGKLGRADSALDPAPVSMIETVVHYRPEYGRDDDGRRVRQWRDHIRSPRDIWDEIAAAARLPGTTAAPYLQPISARLVMLQSGMRAPLGVKVRGPDLESVEAAAGRIESLLRDVPGVDPATVLADRVVGKPYLNIDIDREAAALHGLRVSDIQDVIGTAVGGRTVTVAVSGRERIPVRVRFARERRDSIEELVRLPAFAPGGARVPLGDLAEIRYEAGPQAIKSEDARLVAYVVFDKLPGFAEVDVAEAAGAALDRAAAAGELDLPGGVAYSMAGSWENQARAAARLKLVLPAALAAIFLILYLQFRSAATAAMVFSGVFVAWAGGFILLWLYGQPWFLDLAPLGIDLRQLFGIGTVNLSVAVWVGFVALFGIASDDGVLMATRLDQRFAGGSSRTRAGIRAEVVAAASQRIRPAMMTTATTVLALLPVLTATGRGADLMVPMAIPAFGGMTVAVVTVLVVPVLYCLAREFEASRNRASVNKGI